LIARLFARNAHRLARPDEASLLVVGLTIRARTLIV